MEKLKVIGLLGKSKSGKDTAGRMMVDAERGATLAFADPLKRIVGEMFDLAHEDLYTDEGKNKATSYACLMCPACKSLNAHLITMDRMRHGECRACGTIGSPKVFQSFWTPRTILQHLGTEGFRVIDDQVWVRYALAKAKAMLSGGKLPPRYVAFTDCRFRSEAEGIWNVGGEVWRIKRPATDGTAAGLVGHASEVELESIKDGECQAVIVNDGTLDSLNANLHVQLQRFLGRP